MFPFTYNELEDTYFFYLGKTIDSCDHILIFEYSGNILGLQTYQEFLLRVLKMALTILYSYFY